MAAILVLCLEVESLIFWSSNGQFVTNSLIFLHYIAYDINATNRTLSNQWKYLLVIKHLPFAEARAPDEPDRHAEAEGGQVRPQALLRHGRN